MPIGQIIITVLFFIVTLPLIVLLLIASKQDENPTVITGTETYYGKNKKNTKDEKIDLAVKILTALFVIIIIVSYFV